MTDFNDLPRYGNDVRRDPFRFGLQYPAIGAELGDIGGKLVLDVGCGDSELPILLARSGASVVGVDPSRLQIKAARRNAQADKLEIEYVCAPQRGFSDPRGFDAATCNMVLPYATSIRDLSDFFRCARQHLKPGKPFVSVILNPSFSRFDETIGPRRFIKRGDREIEAQFLEKSGEVRLAPMVIQYSREDYERAVANAGMVIEAWKPMYATGDAITTQGEEFWKRCHETQPYALLVARKH
jgi:2-polyprenyl-3-methyl-5-hydroxy-6-metoxy-1,4-benzoquinol methylase